MSFSARPAASLPTDASHDGSARGARLAQRIAWLVVLALGLRHLWQGRYQISGDGVSYLDIGDALVRGDWATAVTGYWSPLYAGLLGLAIRIAQPAPAWEFAVVGAVNFLVYVLALASFHYLLTGLLRLRRQEAGGPAGAHRVTFPEWAWVALGYACFAWVSLQLIAIWNVAPDMALSAMVYLCAGLLLRIHAGDARGSVMCALGAALGVGYLVKAPMFVLAPVFLVSAAFAIGDVRRAAHRVALAVLVFACVAGPWVLAISLDKRRFTFGESGQINFAWDVNGVSRAFWQGGPARSGRPVHATRQVHTAPDVFEFSRPIRATYPLWHDPSYWYDGVTPYLDAQGLKRPWLESRAMYVHFLREQTPFVLGILALALAGGVRRSWRTALARWPLWAPAAVALGMFAIAGAESRYVAPFVALAMMAALSVVTLRDWRGARQALLGFTVLVLFAQSWLVGKTVRTLDQTVAAARADFEVSCQLGRLGIGRGDRVALLRPATGVYWARLAGVQIVAEVPRDAVREFWATDADRRRETLTAVAGTGARALLSSSVAESAAQTGWIRLGTTGWHAYPLLPPYRPFP